MIHRSNERSRSSLVEGFQVNNKGTKVKKERTIDQYFL